LTQAEALAQVEAEINAATERARSLVMGTEGRLFTVRPDPMRWSAAECLAHLSITTREFIPILRERVDEAIRSGHHSHAVPRMDLLGAALRWFMEPPIRSRVKTAQPFVPKSVRAKADALAEFESLQAGLVDIVRSANGLDLRKLKIRSAFDSRVRYNVYSAFRIIAAHERRHLWQAEKAICMLRDQCV
jgi:hypothetical protein